MKRAVLLMNVGTPNSPSPEDVGVYLKEFLMDPLVIDLPKPARWLLVHGMIVPTRSQTSSEAYHKIWTDRGSPLKFHMEDLTKKLGEKMGMPVKFAMRYQSPSVENVFREWVNEDFDEILVAPLYPQYSLSATKSAMEMCELQAKSIGLKAKLKFLPPFYRDEGFVQAFASLVRQQLEDAEHILFSFHGLPGKQIKKMDESKSHCLAKHDCCAEIGPKNEKYCYRAQCFETARRIAKALDWPDDRFTVSFQSRLNSGWIQPYTDETIPMLARHGISSLIVVCPSFTIDCLETLEEIGLRARYSFQDEGGEDLKLVSCLNSDPQWVDALSQMLLRL